MNGLRRATLTLKDAVKPKFALDIVLQGEPTIVFSVFKSQGMNVMFIDFIMFQVSLRWHPI
jgi:hypothetical protein